MRKAIVVLMALIAITVPVLAATFTIVASTGYADNDVNDDLAFNQEDIQYLFDKISYTVTPPIVDPYDVNLDAKVDFEDVVLLNEDEVGLGEEAPALECGFTKFYKFYNIPETEYTSMTFLYTTNVTHLREILFNYTMVDEHIWSAAGYPGMSNETDYAYVCHDFAQDVFDIIRIDYNLPENALSPVWVGVAFSNHHAYNLILAGEHPEDMSNWYVYEPQTGDLIPLTDIPANDPLYYDFVNAYQDIGGRCYVLTITKDGVFRANHYFEETMRDAGKYIREDPNEKIGTVYDGMASPFNVSNLANNRTYHDFGDVVYYNDLIDSVKFFYSGLAQPLE